MGFRFPEARKWKWKWKNCAIADEVIRLRRMCFHFQKSQRGRIDSQH